MKGWIAKACMTVLLGALSLPAFAATYRVDLIVFLDRYAAGEAGVPARAPAGTGIELDNTAALAAAGIRILPESDFTLTEQWNRLRNAARFQPLLRLAWTQPDPPSERGPALRLRHGQVFEVQDAQGFGGYAAAPVEGSVALLIVNRYLTLDADLRYTEHGGDRHVQFPLRERRRMRRDELHHLDSAKLGILARVTRVD